MAAEGLACKGWAAPEAGKPCELIDFVREAKLGPFDCDLKIMNCGICHSDIHLNDGDWGPFSAFPQVSGHEFVGTVVAVGEYSEVAVGDVCAVGWQKFSCQKCEFCRAGLHNLCAQNTPTCAAGGQGGFSNLWRGDSRFCFKLPEALDPTVAGPLLCGGITVYAPLKKYASQFSSVGVLGIGGLGHMAVKFANAKGNKVTAFSRSDAKKEATLAMGAHVFVNTSDEAQVKAAASSLDVLIVTITASVDWNTYIGMMRPNGVMVFVGAITDKPLELPIFGPLIMKQLSVVGSCIGGANDIREMLEFAAINPKCWPMCEQMPMSKIDEAIVRVKKSDVRFRMVLTADFE